jgi:hypothetical protein
MKNKILTLCVLSCAFMQAAERRQPTPLDQLRIFDQNQARWLQIRTLNGLHDFITSQPLQLSEYINSTDNNCNTLLHKLTEQGPLSNETYNLVEYLIHKGAFFHLDNNQGESVADRVNNPRLQLGEGGMKELLEQARADRLQRRVEPVQPLQNESDQAMLNDNSQEEVREGDSEQEEPSVRSEPNAQNSGWFARNRTWVFLGFAASAACVAGYFYKTRTTEDSSSKKTKKERVQ